MPGGVRRAWDGPVGGCNDCCVQWLVEM